MLIPFGRCWLALAAALAVCTAGGCRQSPQSSTLPPLGAGVPLPLFVAGATAQAPAIASRPPLVAVAFGARDSLGTRLYLSTSTDNGASFTQPEPIDGDAVPADDGTLHLSFSQTNPRSWAGPALRLEWDADGTSVSRLAQPWRWHPFLGVPASQVDDQASPVVSCSPEGALTLVVGVRGPGPASVNHELDEQACLATDRPSAVADVRGWVHAAWAGGKADDTRRVLYAASSDREWFGGAQALSEPGQRPTHVSLVTDPNDTVVTTWEGDAYGARHVFLRQLLPSHHGPATLLPPSRLSDHEGGAVPALASINGGVIVAWLGASGGGVVVKRVGLDAVCATTPAPASARAEPAKVQP